MLHDGNRSEAVETRKNEEQESWIREISSPSVLKRTTGQFRQCGV
jgi:hypothetical protein